MNSLGQVLQAALEMERKGREYYFTAAEKVEDPTIGAILISLAHDEEDHERVINSYYNAMMESKGWPVVDRELPPSADAERRIMKIVDEIAGSIVPNETFIGVYETAREMEMHSRDFYRAGEEETSDMEIIEFFRFLARIEGIHMGMLDILLQSTRSAME